MTVTEKHIMKQTEILKKGLEVMCANGYNSTSVNDIVKAAGIPKGSFYFYFKSKEDFSIKALETYINMFRDEFESTLSDTSVSPLEKVKKIINMKLEAIQNDPMLSNGCYLMKLNGEMSCCNENIRQAILGQITYFKSMVTGIVQEAMDKGEIKYDDATAMTEFIFNSMDGSLELYKATQDPSTLSNFKKVLFDYILK